MPFRATYPTWMMRSMMAARVAGVPNPDPFICSLSSSSSMVLPACSIENSKEASVWGTGGFVDSRFAFALCTVRMLPFSNGGKAVSSSSRLDGYTAFHPCAVTVRPVDLNDCSSDTVMTLAASYSYAG